MLRPQRIARTNASAFESHIDSATAKAKLNNGNDQSAGSGAGASAGASSASTSTSTTLPADAVFTIGGRLKRDNGNASQGTTNENDNVPGINRSHGRILRTTNEETNGVGGSVAAMMSATAQHRQKRMKNEDDVIVSNPSQMSIPVKDQDSETMKSASANVSASASHLNPRLESSQKVTYNESRHRANKRISSSDEDVSAPSADAAPASNGIGFFGKLTIFMMGASTGVAFSFVYAVENSLY